jgi:hypothetical protein
MNETPSPTAHDSRPVPDPTVLTTKQLNREIATVREIIETRLNAMDLANGLHREANERTPDLIKSEIKAIADLSNEKFRSVQIKFDEREEKFRSIQTQFLERDTRSEQSSRDGKIAIDAALQAAKEAVGEQNKSSALAIAKSEAATTKQIDQIIVLINTTTKSLNDLLATTTISLNDKIDDIKSRLTLIEGRSKGSGDLWGYVVGGIGLVVAMATLAVVFTKSFLQ